MFVATFLEVIGATVVGAIVGASATALATYLISVRLERARARADIRRALAVVVAEVGENRKKLEACSRGEHDEHATASWLTYGDWSSGKVALATLESDDPDLWNDLVETYRALYSANHGREGLPDAAKLADVEGRLGRTLQAYSA